MPKINLNELEYNRLVLLLAPSKKIQEVDLFLLKYFLNTKKAFCVYVTVAKPYQTMLNILGKNKIKTDKIFFIDCITPVSAGGGMQRVGNCVFCQPQALTNISISLTTAMQSLPKDSERVLILDTVSTLMLYNETGTVARFVHSLTTKIRQWKVRSVILTLEEETDKKVLSQLSQFVDKVIEVK